MAIALTSLTTNKDDSASGSSTTAVFTPSANSLVFLVTTSKGPTPNISPGNGNGLTWVNLYDPNIYITSNTSLGIWRAMATTPSTGAISISSNFVYLSWDIFELTSVNTTGTNGSGAVAQTNAIFTTGTSGDAPLSLTSAANAIVGMCMGRDSSASITVGSGFTQIDTGTDSPGDYVWKTQWKNGVSQTACDFTYTTPGGFLVSFEVNAASAPAPATGAPSGLVAGAGF